MNILAGLFKTTLGRKFIMALTGAALLFFVIGHMVGNLQIFLGPAVINEYGHFLQSKPLLVWTVRLGLLAMVALHIWAAVTLAKLNRAARPQGYTDTKPVASTYASRTMLMSGLIIFAFIVYHLMHYTAHVQAINLTGKDFSTLKAANGYHDVYGMMVTGFSQPIVSIFYIIAMALLCLHLSHGVSSAFQSVGWRNVKYRRLLDRAALVVGVVLFVGYASIPVAVLTGLLPHK
ncbi:MAG TPA: succinate dehydrogenase cytochrome b subunit [Methylomirabilota bacterium]|nr:succinate dehydrogenase cytochrome b subunit [Methylomirabilota bacterium]